LTFRTLSLAAQGSGEQAALRELFAKGGEIESWLQQWQLRLARDTQSVAERVAAMNTANPEYIPRNHLVQAALDTASESGDLEPFRKLLGILQRPYEHQPEAAEYALPAPPSAVPFQTFCGT
jgi:uncharacterized protein YdiU (UPF0061 family)